MKIKKSLLGSVTESGWWRQQRSAKGEPAASKDSEVTPVQSGKEIESGKPQNVDGEPEQGTEGTMTGLFRKLDFF